MIAGLEELDYRRLASLFSLYERDPLSHCYLAFDVMYMRDRIDLVTEFEGTSIKGYVMLWYSGYGTAAIHVWGNGVKLLSLVELKPTTEKLIVHLPRWSNEEVKSISDFLREKGYEVVTSRVYYDMVLREEWFKPFVLGQVTRLKQHHADIFAEAMRRQGYNIGLNTARELLKSWRCYAIIIEGRIASMACRYLMLPEVGCVGNVYTEPIYRGRGYAKAVTSAISHDIVASGATALLHVESGNEPAIRAYKRIGYRIAGQKLWITARKI
ncbi:hypothetical protein PYJP_02340 [Pyrofollis japonicus]|uniref:GNAT family N-acetyltransferase n=1 Tax=Pyrofollis japonicus TaxID=3060460 RepID=UPI00295B5B36|nr:GNAT family N-acetyltransferase [Pyrofollis japonicus]BEP16882.1 hypothetical protein PYJP_02340 [Pyrofollis japonicus]